MGCISSKWARKSENNFNNIDEVTTTLAHRGLETANLIVGIDFTRTNMWAGATSFHGRSLHHIGDELNPYEQAISIIGRTLSGFLDNTLIPCFGFGDVSTLDRDVFSFYPEKRICNGFEEVLTRYKELVPHLKLSGPTSFAPIIEMAITIVERSHRQYYVLLIIADGPVTGNADDWDPSPQVKETIDSIVKARKYPLSIILVGVGDGSWGTMKNFLGCYDVRESSKFQFVNFTEIMKKNMDISRKEAAFAVAALRGIPSQYKETLNLQLSGHPRGVAMNRVSLPPPPIPEHPQPSNFCPSEPNFDGHNVAAGTSQPASSTSDDNVCSICFINPKNMAFGCGHQTCCNCGEDLQLCPICRSTIQTRIKPYLDAI
ncbi:E3 ubiquitin-protein ligase RGLG1 [Camellia lanceoleosa]|uniref:E3 ubiquitin-protein ligase RGLG1 n=1 Tax=Camellia lanceoleosa TaxID=1840588 RepID=A0ACC0I1E4_9ERIC|nr:E3 ubiquitin-protein ligase RGLG1 [Camellia lanceoleosa]